MSRLALLAHQLTTPLSTISTLAQGMMRRTDQLSQEDIRERAEKIWRASQRLQELIDTVMSYTRANAGAIVPDRSQFNIEALLRRVCSEQSAQASPRTFDLKIRNLPPLITADPILLEQVLIIVLSNATKYSPLDRPIHVIGDMKGDEVTVTVRDEGIGIGENDLPFLMQPFFRGENAKSIPGTGLGLSLAWHILKLHGGRLQIESARDSGTTVTIILPKA
ncbi:sensor histidine kinase [Microvirga terricola]|uniref:histidine kinase n=1 Tax=Microvirga terricola TaxID=2719797 RepID=A0ABX0VAI4_9HYPH|nr:HAMP domain-containing sensor histidine kinase [Microvirga terricola]NIX76204.1 HAMP domain-containing histidine kinase [Microvirga terricola]